MRTKAMQTKVAIPMKKTEKGFEVKIRDIKIPKKPTQKKDAAKPVAPAPKKAADEQKRNPAPTPAPTPAPKPAPAPQTPPPPPPAPEARKVEPPKPATPPPPPPPPPVDKRPPLPFVYTFDEVKKRIAADPSLGGLQGWTLDNNMIKSCALRFRTAQCPHVIGGVCDLGIEFVRTVKQPCGMGYFTTHNFGFIVSALCSFLGVGKQAPVSVEELLRNVPCRVVFKPIEGRNINECIFLGHFLDDKFIYLKELLTCGQNAFQDWFVNPK